MVGPSFLFLLLLLLGFFFWLLPKVSVVTFFLCFFEGVWVWSCLGLDGRSFLFTFPLQHNLLPTLPTRITLFSHRLHMRRFCRVSIPLCTGILRYDATHFSLLIYIIPCSKSPFTPAWSAFLDISYKPISPLAMGYGSWTTNYTSCTAFSFALLRLPLVSAVSFLIFFSFFFPFIFHCWVCYEGSTEHGKAGQGKEGNMMQLT